MNCLHHALFSRLSRLSIILPSFISLALANVYAADITVNAPANNSIVNSPFLIDASSSTCQTQPTASMAYSFDSQTDHIFSGATSLNVNAIAATGSHTLRVKSWGNSGAFCEVDRAITVGNGVIVSAPANDSTVSSPFNLQASAPTCGGEGATSMAYSLDSNTDNLFQGQTSINTSVSASSGPHILRAKAWGNSGAYCETDLSITVSGGGGGGGLIPGSTANDFTHIEAYGAYSGSYQSCVNSQGDPGDLNATGTDFKLWQTQRDCGTAGSKTGSTIYPASPPITPPSGDTSVRETSMNPYSGNGAGVRWFNVIAKDGSPWVTDNYTHFQYDIYVYLDQNNANALYNLEMDINQTTSDGHHYIFATQCNTVAGKWQLGNGWPLTTDQSCSQNQWVGWHHVQIQFHRDSSSIIYDKFALDDGAPQNFTCGGGACSTGLTPNDIWGADLVGPNFQLDGRSCCSSLTAYMDSFTIYEW